MYPPRILSHGINSGGWPGRNGSKTLRCKPDSSAPTFVDPTPAEHRAPGDGHGMKYLALELLGRGISIRKLCPARELRVEKAQSAPARDEEEDGYDWILEQFGHCTGHAFVTNSLSISANESCASDKNLSIGRCCCSLGAMNINHTGVFVNSNGHSNCMPRTWPSA